jgi:hypothetical protein
VIRRMAAGAANKPHDRAGVDNRPAASLRSICSAWCGSRLSTTSRFRIGRPGVVVSRMRTIRP